MRTDLLTLALVALCVVAITVLAALGVTIPDVLVTVALVGVGGATGAAVPTGRATATAKHAGAGA